MATYQSWDEATRRTLNSSLSDLQRLAGWNARAIAQAVADQAQGQIAEILQDFATNLNRAVRVRPDRMRKLYEEVAKEGQRALVESYEAQHGHGPKYRYADTGRWHRYSNNVLLNALKSPNMYRVAADGIEFINIDWLDQQAAQWYRLNFGAAPRGSSARPAQTMTFFGSFTVPAPDLNSNRPSKPFRLPRGFFSEMAAPRSTSTALRQLSPHGEGRRQPFYPLGGIQYSSQLGRAFPENSRFGDPVMTRGIRGTRFLDRGVEEINRLFPTAVERIFNEWISEAQGGSLRGARPGPGGPMFDTIERVNARKITEIQNRIKAAQSQRQAQFYKRLGGVR